MKCKIYELFQAFRVISYAVMIHYIYSQIIKLLRKPGCIGIDDLAEKDFRTYCKQSCLHMVTLLSSVFIVLF